MRCMLDKICLMLPTLRDVFLKPATRGGPGPGHPAQGGLARLPRPGDHDHRIIPGHFLQLFFQGALYHEAQDGMEFMDCQSGLQIMNTRRREGHGGLVEQF